MKIAGLISVVFLAALSSHATAENAWRDVQGRPAAESDSSKSIDGFSGMLLITPDKDWAEKWDTSPETVPHFASASEVVDGNSLFMLTFFAGPGRDSTGRTNVLCDFAMVRPDGSKSIEQTDVLCFQVELKEHSNSLYLAPAVVGYLAEAGDQRGTWTFHMTLKDKVRGVEIPLKTSFLVK